MSALPVPEDEQDERVLADVQKFGWHVAKIPEHESTPGWAYSIGLCHSFDHPEIVVFGLELDMMHELINHMGARVRNGASFAAGTRTDQVLEGYECALQAVHPAWFPPFLGYANWFNRGPEFPAVQCVWPDRSGRLPDEPGFDPALVALQPLLWHEDPGEARVEALLQTLHT